MPVQPITSLFLNSIENIKNNNEKIVCYFDTDIKGFMIELRPSGGATYYFRYRDKSKKFGLQKLVRLAPLT